MKWISSIFFVFFMLITQIQACTCWGVDSEFGIPVYVVMSCENNVCQQAVTIEYDALNGGTKNGTHVFDTEIIPYTVNYPALSNQNLSSAQSKMQPLNGVYKMIIARKTNEEVKSVDIIQVLDHPDPTYISNLSTKYNNASNAYTNYMSYAELLSSIITTLGFCMVALYFLLLFFNSINIIFMKAVPPATQNSILNIKHNAKTLALWCAYYIFAFVFVAALPYLQERYLVLIDQYIVTISLYAFGFVSFALLVFYDQYKILATAYRYALQRTVLIMCFAVLSSFFGLLYVTGIGVGAFFIICALAILFTPIMLFKQAAGKLNEAQKSNFIKLQAKMFILIVTYLIALTICLYLIDPRILNQFITRLLALIIGPLLTIIILIGYSVRLVYIGLSKKVISVAFVFLVIVAYLLLMSVYENSSTCSCPSGNYGVRAKYNSMLSDTYLKIYSNYARINVVKN